MAKATKFYGTSAMTHRCEQHDDKRIPVCSGLLRNGGSCVNKATNKSVPGMMPTCGIHRDQRKESSSCRAPLPCGFECGRLFEWKPHGFQLCPGHRKDLTTCYFLTIPREMRLRVYKFLLPDKCIPAHYRSSRALTTDGEGVYTAILRVNKLIHDEAAALLYSTKVFTIQLSDHGLSMCNSAPSFFQYELPSYGNSALQDYQLQLMLLQQQNKRRRIMDGGKQDNIGGGSSSDHNSAISGIQTFKRSHNPYECKPMETFWRPPIGERYFNVIRSFLIEFVVFARVQGSASRLSNGPTTADVAIHKYPGSRLYYHSDHLHKLIERLQLIQSPIPRLGIVFRFHDASIEREESFLDAMFLLRPFRRLCNIAKSNVLSITKHDMLGSETEFLTPDFISCTAGRTFADYLKCWSRDLSSSQPSCESPQIYKAFWQLLELVSKIKDHGYSPKSYYFQLTELLNAARVARESEDLAHFKEVWEQVVNIWLDFTQDQNNLQSSVAQSIHAIYEIIGSDSKAGRRDVTGG